jgi:hypothetical protein
MGPLLGAALRSSVKSADSKAGYMFSKKAIIKVSCEPRSVDAKLGTPEIESVNKAIEWEMKKSAQEALKKQSSEVLKKRAADLVLGKVQPKRRSGAL